MPNLDDPSVYPPLRLPHPSVVFSDNRSNNCPPFFEVKIL